MGVIPCMVLFLGLNNISYFLTVIKSPQIKFTYKQPHQPPFSLHTSSRFGGCGRVHLVDNRGEEWDREGRG